MPFEKVKILTILQTKYNILSTNFIDTLIFLALIKHFV